MATIAPSKFRPAKVSPLRHDPPGAVAEMPRPSKIHHVHIYSDVHYDEMVEYYRRMFAAEVTRVNPNGLTFMAFDEHDHRIVIIPRPGWGVKPETPVGVSHLAFAYASLGELLFVYKRMRDYGYPPPDHCVNHGNSTSLYYKDPDGNTVETMIDNYTPLETQDYKRHYQWSEEFGQMSEGVFDPAKMLELYESGVSDTVLIDREEVRRLVREGKL